MTRPVLVIGAARSGTRLVRSVIASGADTRAVPFDVNYIWRYGNDEAQSDVLPPGSATPRVVDFIRSRLGRAAGIRASSGERLVEKTVGNILRVPFVAKVFPDAYYVYLVRDGRDVVESAMRSWQEPPRAGYLAAKLRTFPWMHGGRYAWRYAWSVGGRMLGMSSRVRVWGPEYPGMRDDAAAMSLPEVCAKQWVECVEAFERDRGHLPSDRTIEVRYEALVADPGATALDLAKRLELADPASVAAFAAVNVRGGRVGSHRELEAEDRARVAELIAAPLARLGYAA